MSATKNKFATAASFVYEPRTFTKKEVRAIKPGTWMVIEQPGTCMVVERTGQAKKKKPQLCVVMLVGRIDDGITVRFFDPQKKCCRNLYAISVIKQILNQMDVPVLTFRVLASQASGRIADAKTPTKRLTPATGKAIAALQGTTQDVPGTAQGTGWPFQEATLDNAPKMKVAKEPKKGNVPVTTEALYTGIQDTFKKVLAKEEGKKIKAALNSKPVKTKKADVASMTDFSKAVKAHAKTMLKAKGNKAVKPKDVAKGYGLPKGTKKAK